MKRILCNIKENVLEFVMYTALMFALESSIIYTHHSGMENALCLMVAILIAILLSGTICAFGKRRLRLLIECHSDDRKALHHVWLYVLVLIVAQIPIFLAFYPGICTYDLNVQIDQYETGVYITNHPLIHTLYVGFFKNLFESPNIGYAISNVIQIICMDFAVGYALKILYCKSKSTVLVVTLLALYALNPVYGFMGISSTKDIFFSIFMFVSILILTTSETRGTWGIVFVVAASLTIMLRNNAVYAFVLSLVIIVIMYVKQRKNLYRCLLLGFSIIVLSVGLNKVLSVRLGANEGSIKEMMSIPVQSMARIYNVSTNDDEKKLIISYIEEPERYKYYISDPVKEQLEFDGFVSKCKHFLLDSAILSLKHPVVFFDSFMYTTQGYWDLFHAPYQSEHSYLASEKGRGGAEHDSKFATMEQFCLKYLSTSAEIERFPFLAIFLDNGLYIWLSIYCLIRAIREKKERIIMVSVFLLFYLLTLYAGPGAFTRYAFPYFLISPYLFARVIIKENSNQ